MLQIQPRALACQESTTTELHPQSLYLKPLQYIVWYPYAFILIVHMPYACVCKQMNCSTQKRLQEYNCYC